MSESAKAEFSKLMEQTKALREFAPGAMAGFAETHKGVMIDGAIDRKTKELIALAVGVNMRCEGCILSHARSAIRAGATMSEIGEAVGVSILLGGGPATVYGAKALAAAAEFQQA